ncbi:ABC transporter ATP-binding protein [Leptolyngbya sp. FACHB-261]|uniref:ABC transporter ATP-binding protein n=1 Tax=Leptolyngbya sp. FACHB-261 TaxID=2692806 RepID=UPI001688E79C|nr:ABC transporter ATP-binding protein [Leptolyngbya sp. FACHB-261]MBD2102609.1 ABC transporter ATP-binding protein [Leptolyngbya sp. FACHB-261]
MSGSVLDVRHLSVEFLTETETVRAVQDLSFSLALGETLGIVGESGSGKSTAALALLGLLPKSARVTGEILFRSARSSSPEPVNLLAFSNQAMRLYRGGQISMVFQEPLTSLNPVYTCGSQVIEAIQLHETISYREAQARTVALFEEVKLPNPRAIMNRYPHELSGGQIQRVMIAMALSGNPALLIADEPTTALDVTVQATILQLLQEVQERRGMSILFITHDLGVVAQIADSVAVMYQGKQVEYDSAEQIFTKPQHPYTTGLLNCRPQLQPRLDYLPTVADFMEVVTSTSGEPMLQARVGVAAPPVVSQTELDQRLTRLQQQAPLLSVQNLQVFFPIRAWLGRTARYTAAVNGVSFEIHPGETLGLVGESGCGKTTLGRALLRLIEPSGGQVIFDNQNLTTLKAQPLRALRRHLQMIFQDPFGSLDSRMAIGDAVIEPMRIHAIEAGERQRRGRAAYLLERVGLNPDLMRRYPHELSGGQRQRVCIARALAVSPKFIICDESVSALDVSVQAQVLNLLKELQSEFQLTYLFISHDLSVVKFMSDRIMVMNRGKIEEIGPAETIFKAPAQDYTRKLIQATPEVHLDHIQARQLRRQQQSAQYTNSTGS